MGNANVNAAMPIDDYEDVLGEILESINASRWRVDNEEISLTEVAAPNGFMPAWASIATATALQIGLITNTTEFPVQVRQTDAANFGVEAYVPETEGSDQKLPDTMALLLLSDAIYQAISLNNETQLQATREVDLEPMLIQLEMSQHEQEQQTNTPRL